MRPTWRRAGAAVATLGSVALVLFAPGPGGHERHGSTAEIGRGPLGLAARAPEGVRIVKPRLTGLEANGAPAFQEEHNAGYDGRFIFVRLRFDVSMTRGFFGFNQERQPPWAHDYPRAERNFAKILDEVTLLAPYLDGGNIYTLDNPELNRYPIAYMSEPGFWSMDEDEMEGIRNYLLKGGFLIFDDFRGPHWYNFQEQMRRVLPEARPIRIDVTHPVFHAFFDIKTLDWVGPYNLPTEYYGFFEDNDPSKRLMAIANYNNDIGDYWEWSDQGWLPIELSNEAYKLGVNYVVYAMTH